METLELIDTKFVNEIVEFANVVLDDMGASFETRATAKGKCLQVTRALTGAYKFESRIQIAYAERSNVTDEFMELDMCTNHYAVLVDGATVIDYTLRQFDETVAYPAVMPHAEWLEMLLSKWEDENAFHSIGDTICTDCLIGVDTLCDCDGHYPN